MADRAGDRLGGPERCDEIQSLLLDPQQVRVDGAAGQDERIVAIRRRFDRLASVCFYRFERYRAVTMRDDTTDPAMTTPRAQSLPAATN